MKKFTKKQAILFALDIIKEEGNCSHIYEKWADILGSHFCIKFCIFNIKGNCYSENILSSANQFIKKQDPILVFECKLMVL